jgi:hypothetical protein
MKRGGDGGKDGSLGVRAKDSAMKHKKVFLAAE